MPIGLELLGRGQRLMRFLIVCDRWDLDHVTDCLLSGLKELVGFLAWALGHLIVEFHRNGLDFNDTCVLFVLKFEDTLDAVFVLVVIVMCDSDLLQVQEAGVYCAIALEL